MIDDGDCGEIGGMKIGRGNQSTQRKPAPVPLCPPQIPHDQTRAQTRAATVRCQQLTASAMARPYQGPLETGINILVLILEKKKNNLQIRFQYGKIKCNEQILLTSYTVRDTSANYVDASVGR
jgi:hypothetical protein